MYELHERIKHIRIKRKIPQKTMAEKLGITQPGYSQIESGKYPNMKVETLVKICEILDVSPDYLLAFTDYENSELTKITLFYKDAVDLIIDLEEDERIDERTSIEITNELSKLKFKYEELGESDIIEFTEPLWVGLDAGNSYSALQTKVGQTDDSE